MCINCRHVSTPRRLVTTGADKNRTGHADKVDLIETSRNRRGGDGASAKLSTSIPQTTIFEIAVDNELCSQMVLK